MSCAIETFACCTHGECMEQFFCNLCGNHDCGDGFKRIGTECSACKKYACSNCIDDKDDDVPALCTTCLNRRKTKTNIY